MRGFVVMLALLCGCRQVLGFDDVVAPPGAVDAPTDQAIVADAPDTDSGTDAQPTAQVIRKIDIVAGKVAGGPHTDFPLLFTLTDSSLRSTVFGGDVTSAQGFDITFTADQGGATRLAHEVELYDPLTGTLTAWVKIPSLSATTTFFVSYGDPSITTSQQDAPAVFSNGYAGVWHMDAIADATGQSTTTNFGTSAAAGKIGGARRFGGGNDKLEVPASAAVNDAFDGGGTVEAWIRADGSGGGSFGRIADKVNFIFGIGDGNANDSLQYGHRFTNSGALGSNWNTTTGTMPKGVFKHVVAVYDADSAANNPTIYVDGVQRTSNVGIAPSGTRLSDAADELVIGNRNGQDRGFDGVIDEFRLSRVSRSTDFIVTEFENQSSPSTFYTVGAAL